MKKLNNEQIKQISEQIIKDELKKYNINCNVFPLTTLEYYLNCLFNKDFKGSIFTNVASKEILHYTKKDKKNNTNEDLVILISNLKNNQNIVEDFFQLIKLCYYEVRLSIQQSFDKYSYEGFLNAVDKKLAYFEPMAYEYYPERYASTIDANLYSIDMARNYLKDKYPKVYKAQKQKIDNLEGKYKSNSMLYNASNQINKVITISRDNRIRINNISPIFKIFIKDDNNFKEFKDIIIDPEYQKLDKRISYAILSSSSYLEKIDIESLSSDELASLYQILQYTSAIYNNQFQLLIDAFNKNYINSQQYVIIQIELKNNISEINRNIELIEQMQDQKRLTNKIG